MAVAFSARSRRLIREVLSQVYHWAVEQTNVMENVDRVRYSQQVCDCRAHEPCNVDFLASAIPLLTARAVHAR